MAIALTCNRCGGTLTPSQGNVRMPKETGGATIVKNNGEILSLCASCATRATAQ